MPYTWSDHPVYRYRDDKGRFVAQRTLWRYSEQSIADTTATVRPLAYQLEDGAINLQNWEQTMRDSITKEIMRQYMLGIGGANNMTPADYGSVGGMVADQFRYLSAFADRIAAGEYSAAKIAAISAMYIQSANEAFNRAAMRVRGIPELPAYPGDGDTPCLTNCKCHWEFVFSTSKGEWKCYWRMSEAEHCVGCIENANTWNPLIVEREERE